MKLQIDIDENISEDAVIIHCREMSDEVIELQRQIMSVMSSKMQLHVTKQDMEYYIPVTEVIYLESSDSMVAVHTIDQTYFTKQKLYALEEMLPSIFMRVSKSTIINTSKVRGIQKNITGASAIEFARSNKKAYASRNYIKALMDKLEEKRLRR